jgi:hypothetical protein
MLAGSSVTAQQHGLGGELVNVGRLGGVIDVADLNRVAVQGVHAITLTDDVAGGGTFGQDRRFS